MFDLVPFGRGPLSNRDRDLFDYFDKMDRAFFRGFEKEFSPCRTDVLDQGGHYLLQAELPGFQKEDIKLSIEHNMLTISAEHREDKESFVRRERHYGAFSRSFDLDGIDVQGIDAKYENGILELKLPKLAQPPVPPSRQIEIK